MTTETESDIVIRYRAEVKELENELDAILKIQLEGLKKSLNINWFETHIGLCECDKTKRILWGYKTFWHKLIGKTIKIDIP